MDFILNIKCECVEKIKMIETTLIYLKMNNKILMLHRTKKMNDINHDKWLGIGGKIEINETPDECIVREVEEETGFKLLSYKRRGYIMFYNTKCVTEKIYLYESEEFFGDIIDCDEGELSWVDINKILDLNLWEGDRIFLEELINTNNDIAIEFHYDGDKLISYNNLS